MKSISPMNFYVILSAGNFRNQVFTNKKTALKIYNFMVRHWYDYRPKNNKMRKTVLSLIVFNGFDARNVKEEVL